jgi:signal transduction histidine kinase
MRWPIRSQLLLPLLTLLLGIVGISSWTALGSAQRAREQIEAKVRNIARTLTRVSIPLRRVLEHMKGLTDAEFVLVGSDGSRLGTAGFAGASFDLSAVEPVSGDNDWQNIRLGPVVRIGGANYLCSGMHLDPPQTSDHPDIYYTTLYIFYPEDLLRDAIWQAIRPSLVLGGFVGLASLALAIGISQRLSRRIQALERRTRMIARGDFSPKPLPGLNDELRDLGQSVNEMAAQLARLQETVQKTERLRLLGQLSGGLVHQLRNGVAGARLAIQLHARSQPSEALDVALRQLSLAEVNLKRFLALGATDQGRRECLFLTTLISEIEGLVRPQCGHAGIQLHWRPPAIDCTVRGDAGQLQQLFLNVISNAIEAAGPNGWVALSMERHPAGAGTEGSVDVEVCDSGPGPPVEIVPRLFEVFVTSKPEGVGLGLAVARQVAEAHGGGITWERKAGHTCFRITLPLDRPGINPCQEPGQ